MDRNNDFKELKELISYLILTCKNEELSWVDEGICDGCCVLWDFREKKFRVGLSRDITPFNCAMAVSFETEGTEEWDHVITVDPNFLYLLSFEQKIACLAHELGHIFLNHEGSEDGNRNLSDEFEADLFGASILGKEFFLEVLRSFIRLEKLYNDADEEDIEEYYKRIENLLNH